MGVPAIAEPQARRSRTPLSKDVLQAVAEVVLPATELKPEGVVRVVADFQKWLGEFEPVAEQDHPYLTSSDIVYGPSDPRGRWQAQLEALDIEAQKELGKTFQSLSVADRRRAIERAIRNERLDRLPAIAEGSHVAIGLAAFFYTTPEANDLCYEAAIGRARCRGLESGPQKPTVLSKRG
jgi:gluconate 2-dehydrogenase subunit 3-like protein